MFGAGDEAGATGDRGHGQVSSASLSSTVHSTTSSIPHNAQQSQTSTLGGGGGTGVRAEPEMPEECVICLTDPKDTLLLPCRHLCVCSECFRHVDKCPVCRSAFDNYIVLESAQTAASPAITNSAGINAVTPAAAISVPPPPPLAPTISLTSSTTAPPMSTEAVVNVAVTGRSVPGFRAEGGVPEEGGGQEEVAVVRSASSCSSHNPEATLVPPAQPTGGIFAVSRRRVDDTV